MQSPVAAIRATHPRTRIVRPLTRQRERQLGLRGGALAGLVPAPSRSPRGRVDAVRGSGLTPEPNRPRTSPLRRAPQFRWSRSPAAAERGPVARRATPWPG